MIEKIDIVFQKQLLAEAESNLNVAKTALRILSVINLMLSLLIYIPLKDMANPAFLLSVLISVIFLIISFFVNKFPQPAVIAGLIFYTLIFSLYIFTVTFTGYFLIFVLALFAISGFAILGRSLKFAKEVESLRDLINKYECHDLPLDLVR